MGQTDLFDDMFSEDDDGAFSDLYLVVKTVKSSWRGDCNLDETHTYRSGDIIGKLERSDNPFIPVSGWCCNKCVRTTTHKRSVT